MRELLVFIGNNSVGTGTAIDAIHVKDKDRRGSYKAGMIVCAREDGHKWGRLESKRVWTAQGGAADEWPNNGKLAILKVSGLSVSQAQKFTEEQIEDDTGRVGTSVFRRRKWRLDLDELPDQIVNDLAEKAEASVTLQQIRQCFRKTKDGAQYTGAG